MKLLINVPAYNEEKAIYQTVSNLPRQVAGFDEVKIQVLDDGSTDQTKAEAMRAGADYIFSNEVNRGIGITFRRAVLHALENGFDVMVNIDADGQFDPSDITKLTQPIIDQKADIAIGSRFSGISPKNMPLIKKTLNSFASKIVGLFLGIKTDDITCGFRAYNRESMLRLNLPHQFTYTQESIIDALEKKLKIVWVPAAVTYFADRKPKVTKSIYRFITQSGAIIFKTLRDTRPLKFFGIPATIMIGASLIIFVGFFIQYLQTLKITPYSNWIFAASVLLILGIQFMVFALLADMIKSNRKLVEDEMYERRQHYYNHKK